MRVSFIHTAAIGLVALGGCLLDRETNEYAMAMKSRSTEELHDVVVEFDGPLSKRGEKPTFTFGIIVPNQNKVDGNMPLLPTKHIVVRWRTPDGVVHKKDLDVSDVSKNFEGRLQFWIYSDDVTYEVYPQRWPATLSDS